MIVTLRKLKSSTRNYTCHHVIPSYHTRMSSRHVMVCHNVIALHHYCILLQILLDGAALLGGVRMLVQAGWSEISQEIFADMMALAATRKARATSTSSSNSSSSSTGSVNASEDGGQGRHSSSSSSSSVIDFDALLIGSLPHDWLFPHLKAVIHHGGAGETSFFLNYFTITITHTISPYYHSLLSLLLSLPLSPLLSLLLLLSLLPLLLPCAFAKCFFLLPNLYYFIA
jgi:hypothetical protein